MYGKSIGDNYLKLSTSIIYIILHVAQYTGSGLFLTLYMNTAMSCRRMSCSVLSLALSSNSP